jgi:hypothetical protein
MKIALVFIACLFASCSSLPADKRASLVGAWRYADAGQSCRYHFKKDGTFVGEIHLEAKLVSKFRGAWTVQGDYLLYRYTSDELRLIPVGATDRDKLLSVQRGSFLIEAANGSRRRYLRLR